MGESEVKCVCLCNCLWSVSNFLYPCIHTHTYKQTNKQWIIVGVKMMLLYTRRLTITFAELLFAWLPGWLVGWFVAQLTSRQTDWLDIALVNDSCCCCWWWWRKRVLGCLLYDYSLSLSNTHIYTKMKYTHAGRRYTQADC